MKNRVFFRSIHWSITAALALLAAVFPLRSAQAQTPTPGVCEFAKETARVTYEGSGEQASYKELQEIQSQYWHEANLIHQQLLKLRERIRAWPAYKAAEPEFKKIHEALKSAGPGPLFTNTPTARKLEVLRKLAYEAWKKDPNETLIECSGLSGVSKMAPDSEWAQGLPVNGFRVLYSGSDYRVEGVKDSIVESTTDKVPAFPNCSEDEDSTKPAHRFSRLTFEPEPFGGIRVGARNDEFGHGSNVVLDMRIEDLMFRPLPAPSDVAKVLAKANWDTVSGFSWDMDGKVELPKPLNREDYAIEKSRAACGPDQDIVKTAAPDPGVEVSDDYQNGYKKGYQDACQDPNGCNVPKKVQDSGNGAIDAY